MIKVPPSWWKLILAAQSNAFQRAHDALVAINLARWLFVSQSGALLWPPPAPPPLFVLLHFFCAAKCSCRQSHRQQKPQQRRHHHHNVAVGGNGGGRLQRFSVQMSFTATPACSSTSSGLFVIIVRLVGKKCMYVRTCVYVYVHSSTVVHARGRKIMRTRL